MKGRGRVNHFSRPAFVRMLAIWRKILGQAQGSASTHRRKSRGQAPTLQAPDSTLHSLRAICFIAVFASLPFTYSTVSAASAQDQHIKQAQHAILVSS